MIAGNHASRLHPANHSCRGMMRRFFDKIFLLQKVHVRKSHVIAGTSTMKIMKKSKPIALLTPCILGLLSSFTHPSDSFITNPAASFHRRALMDFSSRTFPSTTTTTTLYTGNGIAKSYRWKEESGEIEVYVQVPANTRVKDIKFKVTPSNIDLRYVGSDNEPVVLLDGSRTLRGKVSMDGTFWSISDNEGRSGREISVMIEKNKRVGEFEVETDWEGVFVDDEGEVLERNYREPEELDVREYCKKELGVDIDNIDMSKVDKTMFSTVNMTRDVLSDLKRGGFVREVTQQGDLEFVEEIDGARKEYKQGIPFIDDLKPAGSSALSTSQIPESPQTPIAEAGDGSRGNIESTALADDSSDPIDRLTVARLKEILREQNLKVSGTKQELRERLRLHIQSLVNNNGEQV